MTWFPKQIHIIVWDIAATLTLCWVTKASERIQMVWQVRDMIDTPFDQKNWFLFVFAGFSSLSYLSAHNNKKRCIKSFYIFHCFQTVDTRDRFDAIHRWTFQYQSHPKHLTKHFCSSLCIAQRPILFLILVSMAIQNSLISRKFNFSLGLWKNLILAKSSE